MTADAIHVRLKRVFSGMPAGAFSHPADIKRLKLLKKVPGIEWLANMLIKHSYEKIVRITHAANAIKVGSDAYPVIHELMEKVCDSLDVKRPDVYVCCDSSPVARATGSEEPVITINTGLLEMLNEDELLCVLAQQVSHIKCEHMWYLMVCDFTRDFSERLGLVGTPLLGGRLALEEWRRRAELSCDRGALLVCGDVGLIVNVLLKMGGAGVNKFGPVSPEVLERQEKDFAEMTKGLSLGRLYRAMMYLDPAQPFSALRAGELKRWAESEEYHNLMAGKYPTEGEVKQSAEESAPLWGEFAHESKASTPVEPVCSPVEMLLEGLKTTAAGAAGIAQKGASAISGGLEDAFGSFFRSSE
ncbi:MAG: M48 family metallopeptidase [Planctomycetes bacterium]|nr:M48 family metallopeptidase [Planctomycetota bacterium]